jgi:hypothetical protein
MPVNARNSLLSPCGVIKLEIARAMFAIDQIGVLTGIECAVRAGQKVPQVLRDIASGLKICRIVPLLVDERIDSQVVRLKRHDLFEVRLVPIAADGVLIHPAPHRVNQFSLLRERLPRHMFRMTVAGARQQHRVFRAIPVEIFPIGSPAPVFGVIRCFEPPLQLGAAPA